MIKAIIFDLDGTLVQTEIIKANSYAKAVSEISSNKVTEDEVIKNFKNYVGLSRTDVIKNLVKDYSEKLINISHQIEDIEDLLIEKRLEIYNNMLEDPGILPRYCCKMTMGFLHSVFEDGYLTGLATMSHCMQVERVLKIMNIKNQFKFVITRDEIENAKPHPEIYLRMKNKLGVESEECVVIEDSTTGIKAALSANMNVFAVTNSITKDSVHKSKLIDKHFIVDDPSDLKFKVYDFIKQLL